MHIFWVRYFHHITGQLTFNCKATPLIAMLSHYFSTQPPSHVAYLLYNRMSFLTTCSHQSASCYHTLYHNFSHLVNITFVASKILLQLWKQMKIAQ